MVGHSWSINFFPNGDYFFSAVYLACAHEVMARFMISLLDEAGKATYSMSTAGEFRRIPVGGKGFPRFTRKDGMERRGYVRDDRLRIRCDITVLQVIIQHHDDEDAADAATIYDETIYDENKQ